MQIIAEFSDQINYKKFFRIHIIFLSHLYRIKESINNMISTKMRIYRLCAGINKNAIIILFLNLISVLPLYAQNTGYSYEHFTTNEGLSQITVKCLLQDKSGYLWIGTNDGLNRYDGYEFKTFKHIPFDKNSIYNNRIFSIFEDVSGLIWIGTEDGISSYDPETERITNYETSKDSSPVQKDNFIRDIFESLQDPGKIWIGTRKGIKIFDKKLQIFLDIKDNPKYTASLKTGNIKIISRGSGKYPLIADFGGVNVYDSESGKFIYHQLIRNPSLTNSIINILEIPDNPDKFIICSNFNIFFCFDFYSKMFTEFSYISTEAGENNEFHVFHIMNDGTILTGSFGNLFNFNPDNRKFSFSWSNNEIFYTGGAIKSILKDLSGNIWLGTDLNGLYKLRPKKDFVHYYYVPDDPQSLGGNLVYSILEQRNKPGDFLIGTTGGGIFKYKREEEVFFPFKHKLIEKSIGKRIWTLYEDASNDLWIGIWGGLFKYDFNTEKITEYKYSKKLNSIGGRDVLTITESPIEPDVLWIGTYDGGLTRYDKKSNSFTYYLRDPDDNNSLCNNMILYLYVSPDEPGILWIGTNGGLDRFDIKSKTFKHYVSDFQKPGSLSHNTVKCIYKDKTGVLWIGTNGGGLNKFNSDTETFTSYSEIDGLPNNTIYGILEDSRGCLWLSTNNGLSRFNPGSETFENFSVIDGIQDKEFNTGAFCRSSAGEMLFGGINGITLFHPDSIKKTSYTPQMVISELKLFNKPVLPGEKTGNRIILKKSVNCTDELVLSYKDKFISFEFSILDFTEPSKNQYSLWMEGLDEKWQDLGTKRTVDFNLEPGDYTLRIKGVNSSGIWTKEETALRIIVTPPLWKTLWFRILLSGGILILVTTAHKSRTSRLKKKQLFLEKHKELLEKHQGELEKNKKQLEKHQEQLEFRIQKQKNAEKLLKESEKRYRSIVQDQSELIIRWKPDGICTFINEASSKMFNISPEELIGRNLFKFLSEKDINLIKNNIYALTQENPFFYNDKSEIIVNGIKVYFHWYNRALFDENGELIEYQSVGRDITRQKEFEFQLKKSTDELRKLSNYLQSVREKERTHIAHEIHDELGHNLTVLKMDLKLMRHSLPHNSSGIPKRIEGMIDIIDKTITAVKRLSTELRPGVLDELGLNSALEWLIKELKERTDIDFIINIEFNDNNLSKDFATAVFRISQEALTNAIRHSGANFVSLELKERNDKIFLNIKDNGIGIGEEKTDSSESFGLIGLRERAYAIGGTLEIEGKENIGTTLRLESPIIRGEIL